MEISFDKLLKIVALMALSGQLATLANGASDYSIGNDIQGSISSSSSFLMDQMRRYFGAAMDPEPQSAFSNWQADDRIRKQRLLKDAVGKATGKLNKRAQIVKVNILKVARTNNRTNPYCIELSRFDQKLSAERIAKHAHFA